MYEHIEMAGVPQHIGYVTLQPGEEKRHCSRCKYHYGKNKGNCSYTGKTCIGSAQCEHYKEVTNAKASVKANDEYVLPKAEKKVSSFEGIKNIRIDMIDVNSEQKIDHKEINRVVESYKRDKSFKTTLVVEQNGDKYKIIENAAIYFAAKVLALKEVPAELNGGIDTEQRNMLRTLGTLVYAKKKGDVGEVVEFSLDTTTIRFDSGEMATYKISEALKIGALRIL